MKGMTWRAALAAAALVLAQPLSAQVVRGRVVEYGSGYPVGLARVTVLDEGGQPVGYGQSNGWGEFTIRLQRSGRVFIRAELIGYRSATSPLSDVQAGDEIYRVLALRKDNAEIAGGDGGTGWGGLGFIPRGILGPRRGGATATDTRPAPATAPAPAKGGDLGAAVAGATGRRPATRSRPATKPRGDEPSTRTPRPERPATRGGGSTRRPAQL